MKKNKDKDKENMEFNDGDIEHALYKVRENELSTVQEAFQSAYHRWVRHEDDEKMSILG